MKRFYCDFSEVTFIDNLNLAFTLATKNKHNRKAYRKFISHYDERIAEIQDALINKTYQVSHYREKVIFEPKRRTIYVLPLKDHVIQHAMMNILQPYMNKRMYEHSYACRPGLGIHAGAIYAAHLTRAFNYCLKGDMSKFYPSINQNIMFDIMERMFKGIEILWLLGVIIFSFPGEINVPIGNYTSQWFGNLYLDEMDKYILEVLHPGGYIRYCDDFLLFDNNKDKLKECRDWLEDWVYENRHLVFSKDDIFKTKTQGVDFLGYRFFQRYTLLRKSTSKRLRYKVHELWNMINSGYIFSREEALINLSAICSAIGWIQWADCDNFRKYLGIDKLREYFSQIFHYHKTCDKFNIQKDLKGLDTILRHEWYDPTLKVITDWR